MSAVILNALASVLAFVNFLLGAGGRIHWLWLISCACFGAIAIREYRKQKPKE